MSMPFSKLFVLGPAQQKDLPWSTGRWRAIRNGGRIEAWVEAQRRWRACRMQVPQEAIVKPRADSDCPVSTARQVEFEPRAILGALPGRHFTVELVPFDLVGGHVQEVEPLRPRKDILRQAHGSRSCNPSMTNHEVRLVVRSEVCRAAGEPLPFLHAGCGARRDETDPESSCGLRDLALTGRDCKKGHIRPRRGKRDAELPVEGAEPTVTRGPFRSDRRDRNRSSGTAGAASVPARC